MRPTSGILLGLLTFLPAFCQTYTISTFAGGGLPVNIQGPAASVPQPQSVAVDAAGDLFILKRAVNRGRRRA